MTGQMNKKPCLSTFLELSMSNVHGSFEWFYLTCLKEVSGNGNNTGKGTRDTNGGSTTLGNRGNGNVAGRGSLLGSDRLGLNGLRLDGLGLDGLSLDGLVLVCRLLLEKYIHQMPTPSSRLIYIPA